MQLVEFCACIDDAEGNLLLVTVVAQVVEPANMDWLDDYWCGVFAEIVSIHDPSGQELILATEDENALLDQAISEYYKGKQGYEETLAAICEDQTECASFVESPFFSFIKTDTNEITSQRA